ncbi:hypothetical protein ACWGID_10105 [Kribbella sp. NPDC054772]
MGSSFGRGQDDRDRLFLSNGGTDVFLDVLALAACELARSDFERRFALLLCNSRIGMGNDDFDLDELPWSAEFIAEREFLLRVIALAATGFRWAMLSYEPPYAEAHLRQYGDVVRGYTPPGEAVEVARMWDEHPPERAFERCGRHGLFVGDYRDCRLCA